MSSGNTVLAAAARGCLPRLVDLVRFESLLKDGLLLSARRSKAPAAKTACLAGVLQALQTWPLPLL